MDAKTFQMIRKRHWQTQPEAAEALGYKRDKTISEWENGHQPIPETVAKLLRYVEKYGADLLEG